MTGARYSRRELLALSAAALAGCSKADGYYFGRVSRPQPQRLVVVILAEPATLDPHLSADRYESYIIHSLFERLTGYHPADASPVAALATHYDVTKDGLRYQFFLRGHPQPRGNRLPHPFERPERLTDPARWSDGSTITAHDLVYSWRRVVAPETVAPLAYIFGCVRNGTDIFAGKRSPEALGVSAPHDYTFEVELSAPTPYLPQLAASRTAFAVPRQAIDAARNAGRESRWTEPGRIVTSGAFSLIERRSYDSLTLRKSALFYDATRVALSTVQYLVVTDPAITLNLYKSGIADLMRAEMPPQFMLALETHDDFAERRSFATVFPMFNVRRPPFNNVLMRYAFNLATDKRDVCNLLGGGMVPAKCLVPPISGYTQPQDIVVQIAGRALDVAEFNPEASRALLAAAGYPNGRLPSGGPLVIAFLYPKLRGNEDKVQVLQQQWRNTLGVEVTLAAADLQAWIGISYQGQYRNICDWGDAGAYLDPQWFLDQFVTGSGANGTGWNDPVYDSLLREAEGIADARSRLARMADCERYLVRAMPFMPLYFDSWTAPKKPYVRGIEHNEVSPLLLKYASIDTSWRAA